MESFNKPGNIVTVAAPANVTSGIPFILGVLLCIPVASASSGDDVAVAIEGVFELPKVSTDTFVAGQLVNWESGAANLSETTGTAGDLNGCAVVLKAAGSGVATAVVKLVPGNGVAGT